MSRSFRKYPRNKYNDRQMKKYFNRRFRRKVNAGEFDTVELPNSGYRKVNNPYEISDGSIRYSLEKSIQPEVEVKQMMNVYTWKEFDESHNFIFEKEKVLGTVQYKVNTNFFDFPASNSRKNPYPKNTSEFEGFNKWMKFVGRK